MNKGEVYNARFLQKVFPIGSCLALVSMMFCLTPVAGRADVGPFDGEITVGIQSRLHRAGIYKYGQVNVQVKNGIATLTGTVDTYGEKLHVVRAARHQDGVQKVVDKIGVNTEDVGTSQILAKARHHVLMFPYYTIFDHITLSAKGNDLTLGGEVTEPYKKSTLGNILANIKGIAHLQNNIKVLPTSGVDDEVRMAIATRIYGDPMFANYANQANPPIHIIVDNGHVTLYGAVNSKLARQKAELDARFAATYFGLKNNLRITS